MSTWGAVYLCGPWLARDPREARGISSRWPSCLYVCAPHVTSANNNKTWRSGENQIDCLELLVADTAAGRGGWKGWPWNMLWMLPSESSCPSAECVWVVLSLPGNLVHFVTKEGFYVPVWSDYPYNMYKSPGHMYVLCDTSIQVLFLVLKY